MFWYVEINGENEYFVFALFCFFIYNLNELADFKSCIWMPLEVKNRKIYCSLSQISLETIMFEAHALHCLIGFKGMVFRKLT